MRIRRNFAAGLANSIWSAIVNFAAIPFYIKYLGVEAYGLIGFFVTMQAVLQLLDLGLSPTINREVARGIATGRVQEARNLLHTLAYVYWGTATFIALLIFIGSQPIADHWLQTNTLPRDTIIHALALMGLIISARWPIGLYAGAITGAQRLVVSSAVSMLAITLGNIGAIFILAFVSPTITAFFTWQALTGILYALAMRKAAWTVLGRTSKIHADLSYLKRVWQFSAGMAGVAVAGVILIQADKVILSRLLSLEDYGRYTLAAVAASALYVFLTPLYNSIFPQLTRLVSNSDEADLKQFYKTATRTFLALLFPITATVSLYSRELVEVWTGNQELSQQVAPLVSILISGTALNGIMHFPYALQLSYGKYQIALKICLLLILIMIPTVYILTGLYGAIGGATSWLITNVAYLLLGTGITHRHLLRGSGVKWFLCDVGKPFVTAYFIVFFFGMFIKSIEHFLFIKLTLALLVMLLGILTTMLLTPAAREVMIRYLIPSKRKTTPQHD